jgi:formamidopyrimidine-DNA glycosylase
VPEFPEVEALRRALDEPVGRAPVERAGPAHIATLKTFDPPLAALEGRRFAGAERRAKHLLFPTEDGELVLHVHLMTAGRLRYLEPGGKGPKTPTFSLIFGDGGMLVLTEAGHRKQARVGLYTPAVVEAELAHLGPEAYGLGAERLAEILRADGRRLHAFLRDQRAVAGIGRAWANEILHRARLSPYALTRELAEDEVERLATTIDDTLAEGLRLREAGGDDRKAYRIHDRIGEPCPQCGTPIAQVDFEKHTVYYCPACQTGGRVLKDRRLSRLGIDPTSAAGSRAAHPRRRASRRARR